MKEENAIEVNDITKTFRVYLDKGHTLKEMALFSRRRKYERRSVLNGISFEVRKGEALGLIGHNGCGKSTTLKLLTRIMYPDSGTIEMRGRVSSLIELGAGFHPDMSGRQNIYTNAAIFGLTKKEINERIERIIEFSELEEFIDNPVRTYSSGMYMRLAFAVAINVDAEILLIDEILAVGDAAFQAKCFDKLHEIKEKGTTIVFVSHSLGQIEEICDRSIWIHQGVIREEGSPQMVHKKYLEFMGQGEVDIEEEPVKEEESVKEEATEDEVVEQQKILLEEPVAALPKRWGSMDAVIEQVSVVDEKGERKEEFKSGEAMQIQVDYSVNKAVEKVRFGIGFFLAQEGILCYGTNTGIDGLENFELTKAGRYTFLIDKLPLLAGTYNIDVSIETEQGEAVDFLRVANQIVVCSEQKEAGIVKINHKWKIE